MKFFSVTASVRLRHDIDYTPRLMRLDGCDMHNAFCASCKFNYLFVIVIFLCIDFNDI